MSQDGTTLNALPHGITEKRQVLKSCFIINLNQDLPSSALFTLIGNDSSVSFPSIIGSLDMDSHCDLMNIGFFYSIFVPFSTCI